MIGAENPGAQPLDMSFAKVTSCRVLTDAHFALSFGQHGS
jgi:hypothetical protein